MKKLYYSLAALLFVAAGCSNNDFMDNGANPVAQKRTITTINATVENADTRVQLVDGHKVVWQNEDHILVFSDETDGWSIYRLSDGEGTTSATFVGDEITGSEFYALSTDDIRNYDAEAKTITFRWPFDGFHKNNSQNWRVIPMFANGSDGNMQFKQLGGLLHFQVVGKGKLGFLALRPLSENYTDESPDDAFPDLYDLSYGESVTVAPSTISIGGRNEIAEWMDDENGEYPELSEDEPYDVYFSLPAGYEFKYGFMVILGVYDENGEFYNAKKITKNPVTINRAAVKNYPAFSADRTVDPEPIQEYGWTTGFENVKGNDVSAVSYYINPSNPNTIYWDLTFVDDAALTQPNYEIMLMFETTNPGGTPTLDMLESLAITNTHVKFHDYKNGGIWGDSSDNDSQAQISKNNDGSWRIFIDGLSLVNVDDSTHGTYFDFEYNGPLTLSAVEPVIEYGWTTGWANLKGKEVSNVFYSVIDSNTSQWKVAFTDDVIDPTYKIELAVEMPKPTVTPTLEVLSELYYTISDVQFTIYDSRDNSTWVKADNNIALFFDKNPDGSWKISYDDLEVKRVDAEAANVLLDFEYNGPLTLVAPKPVTKYGWTTGWENLKGKDVSNVFYSTVDSNTSKWKVVFVDDLTLTQPNYRIELAVETDKPIGTPTLDALASSFISKMDLTIYDNTDNTKWTIANNNELNFLFGKNDDGSWFITIDDLEVKSGDNGNVSRLLDFEYDGPLTLSIADPTPVTEYGWTTGWDNFNGKDVESLYYSVSSSNPNISVWSFSFVDDATSTQPKYRVLLSVETDKPSGTPTLDALAELDYTVSSMHLTIHDYTDNTIWYNADANDLPFMFGKNDDGSWNVLIDGITVSNANDDTATPRWLEFEYNGPLTLSISDPTPTPTASLIGSDGVINTSMLPNGYFEYDADNGKQHFIFTDDAQNIVSFLLDASIFRNPAVAQTVNGIDVDFYVTDNDKKYRGSDGTTTVANVPVVIKENSDGTFTISLSNVSITNYTDVLTGISMTWTGTLQTRNSATPTTSHWDWVFHNTSGSGEGIYGYVAHEVQSAEGSGSVVKWRLRFLDTDFANVPSATTFKQVIITWEEAYTGGTPSLPAPGSDKRISNFSASYWADGYNAGGQYALSAIEEDYPLYIYQTEDDKTEVSIKLMSVKPSSDPNGESFLAGFSFNGTLIGQEM